MSDGNGDYTRKAFMAAVGGVLLMGAAMVDNVRASMLRPLRAVGRQFDLIDDAPTNPRPRNPVLVPPGGGQVNRSVNQVVNDAENHIVTGTAGLIDNSGQFVDDAELARIRADSTEVVCWYLDNEETLANGLTTDEVIGLIGDQLQDGSARDVAESIVESFNEVREAYIARNYDALFLSSAKTTLCGF